MIVSIHQPNFIPWLGFFDKIKMADVFVLLDDVQFVKGTIANRNYIKGVKGEKVLLTVPVMLSKGAYQKYNEIEIDYSQNWQKKHLNQLKNAYYRSTNFRQVYFEFEEIISRKYSSLAELNIEIILWFINHFNITTKLYLSSNISVNSLSKNDRNLELCKYFNATKYISGKGAVAYNDPLLFLNEGIDLQISNFVTKDYPQLHGEFLPNLCALDYLFNKEPEIAF